MKGFFLGLSSRPVKLSPSDLKLVSQGDDLARGDVIHLGDATDPTGSPELGQDDFTVTLPGT